MVSKATANLREMIRKRAARGTEDNLPESGSLESNIIRVKLPLNKDDTKKLEDALSKNRGGSVTYVGKNKKAGDNALDKKLDNYRSPLIDEVKKKNYR